MNPEKMEITSVGDNNYQAGASKADWNRARKSARFQLVLDVYRICGWVLAAFFLLRAAIFQFNIEIDPNVKESLFGVAFGVLIALAAGYSRRFFETSSFLRAEFEDDRALRVRTH